MKKNNLDEINAKKEHIEAAIFHDKDCLSIATVPKINGAGDPTGRYIVEIGLIPTADVNEILKKIKKSLAEIPTKTHDLNAPEASDDPDFKIVKKEMARALSSMPNADVSATPPSGANITYVRPLQGGHSIGHYTAGAGTLGGIVTFEGKNKKFIISNNHVLAKVNQGKKGDPIVQPGKLDGGTEAVAVLSYFELLHPLSTVNNNRVDVGIAAIHNHIKCSPVIQDIGEAGEIIEAKAGMKIEKLGRTTGRTAGTIATINASEKVDMGAGFYASFTGQIRTVTPISQPGDSGSVILERGTKKPVGLLFAGAPGYTLANHLMDVRMTINKRGYPGMQFFTSEQPKPKFSPPKGRSVTRSGVTGSMATTMGYRFFSSAKKTTTSRMVVAVATVAFGAGVVAGSYCNSRPNAAKPR